MKMIHAVAGLLLLAGVTANAQAPGGMPNPGGAGRGGMMGPRQGGQAGPQGGMRGRGQGGGARMARPMAAPAGGLASMLLAHTGALKLTDAQVMRLAAIARRSEERHASMRASMDSMMSAHHPQGGSAAATAAGMPAMAHQMPAGMQRMHDQERADVRDALAVLTIDQQTDMWMQKHMRAMHGPMHGGMK